jgi:hypothetical protein
MYEERIGSVLGHRHPNDHQERNVRRLLPCIEHSGRSADQCDVNATGQDYLDLANSLLHVRAKMVKANGDGMEAASTVGPVNNFLHSLFS